MIVRKLFLCAMVVTCLALAGPAWAGTFNFSGASLGQGSLCLDPTGGNGCGISNGNTLSVGSDGTNTGALISNVLCAGEMPGACTGNNTIFNGYMTLNSGTLMGGGCNGTSCSYTFNGGASSFLTIVGCFGSGSCTPVTLLTAQFVSGDSFSSSGTVGTFSGALLVSSIMLNNIFGSGYHFTGGSGDAITISLDGMVCNNGGICDGLVDDSAASLQFIPEPATLSVLGAGLLALGTGLRRKMLSA